MSTCHKTSAPGLPKISVDQLPPELAPERVIGNTITLLPGTMPSKRVVHELKEPKAKREILQQLNDAKWITFTSSPFAAPAMILSRKDDASGDTQYRVVLNYRELNAATIPPYPLPTNTRVVLDMLHGTKVLTTTGMEKGFHQNPVAPRDPYKTALKTCMREYGYRVMLFCLTGAPGTF